SRHSSDLINSPDNKHHFKTINLSAGLALSKDIYRQTHKHTHSHTHTHIHSFQATLEAPTEIWHTSNLMESCQIPNSLNFFHSSLLRAHVLFNSASIVATHGLTPVCSQRWRISKTRRKTRGEGERKDREAGGRAYTRRQPISFHNQRQ